MSFPRCLVWICLACSAALARAAGPGEAPLLFELPASAPASPRAVLPHESSGAAPGEGGIVQLRAEWQGAGWSALRTPGRRFRVALSAGLDRTLVIDRGEAVGASGFRAWGRVEGIPGSSVILAGVDGAIAGTVMRPGLPPLRIEPAGGAWHRVNQAAVPDRRWCATGILTPGAATPALHMSRAPIEAAQIPDLADAGEETVIDFLVLYTQRALQGAGGESGMRALLEYAVAEANLCYANSGLRVRWNIVHETLTSYADSGAIDTDWERLRTRGDGFLEEAHRLAADHAADLVMLVVEQENQGWAGVADRGFTVFVRPWIASGFYLVPHEVGHLLGAGHDHATCDEYGGGNCGATTRYAYGHRFVADGATFVTVMAYEPGLVIPYFSNPDVRFLGVPTGVPDGMGGAADNARTMREQAPLVARTRQAVSRFEIANPPTRVAEGAGRIELTVTRSGTLDAQASVTFSLVDESATGGADFHAFSTNLVFAPGVSNVTVPVTILQDGLGEGTEAMVAVLSAPSNLSALGRNSEARIAIQDDESTLAVVSPYLSVSEAGRSAAVTVRRDGPVTEPASVRYSVRGASASGPEDFTPVESVLVFASGQTELHVNVDIQDDQVAEPDETLVLSLASPQGVVLGPSRTSVITIVDDDRSGGPDPAYPAAGAGLDAPVFALAMRPDGRVLAGGRFARVGDNRRPALVQYTEDGQPDPNFQSPHIELVAGAGDALGSAVVYRIALLADGRAYIAGDFTAVQGQRRHHVARLHNNGSLDTTFDPGVGPDSAVVALVANEDGTVYLGGSFRAVSGWPSGLIARLLPDGSVDRTFKATPQPTSFSVNTLVVRGDGRIIAGGFFAGFDALRRSNLIRLHPDGRADASFSAVSPNGTVTRLAARREGGMLVGGLFTTPRGKLYAIRDEGGLDGAFAPAALPDGNIRDLLVQPDGRVLMAGEFAGVGGVSRTRVARLTAAGAVDGTFDPGAGPDDMVRALALAPDGAVCLGGAFERVNGLAAPFLARLRSDGTLPVLDSPRIGPGASLRLLLRANRGDTLRLESSTDLRSWQGVWTGVLAGASQVLEPPPAPDSNPRFWRAVRSATARP